jgi:hypothetical protein
MSEAILDFNKRTHKEQYGSDAINAVVDAGLTAKRAKQERRQYLGASAIGGECERSIQFEYAGRVREKEPGPVTLRKFDLGHMGEEIARAWFTDAGFLLTQRNQRTKQLYGFSQLDGRFRGHPDGVFIGGPAVMAYPALWECKSVGAKTAREIERHGLRKARPAYYAQVAIYQAYLDLTDNPAIFTVNNLDSGEQLHLSIEFDGEEAQRMSDRAVRIIKATDAHELLPRPFTDQTHFVCRMCAFAERCWSLPS